MCGQSEWIDSRYVLCLAVYAAPNDFRAGAAGYRGRIGGVSRQAQGTLEIEGGIETGDGDFQKFDALLQPEFDITLSKKLDLTIVPRLRLELIDELEPGHPSQDELSGISRRLYLGDNVQPEMREL